MIFLGTPPLRKTRFTEFLIREGDIIATLADASKSKVDILPHLHISLGWPSNDISYDRLDWKTISASNTLTFLDPLHVIGEKL